MDLTTIMYVLMYFYVCIENYFCCTNSFTLFAFFALNIYSIVLPGKD